MIAVQAPGYFLPINQLALIFHCEKVHWQIQRYYLKQSYRNRAVITDANGEHALVVPVRHPVWQQSFSTVKFLEDPAWKKKQLKALKTAYNKSPFFEWAEPDLKIFFDKEFDSLVDLNLASFELLCRWFGKNPEEILHPREEEILLTEPFQEHSSRWDYHQVFGDKCGFRANLSALDLFFNCGRAGNEYLEKRANELLASQG
jgi:hypothetical protein